ncbi:UDP-N-acetylmuramoyl-L-alanine--D-glutamate ligase [Ihubacter massiliensis]|uniref:UDP-N-acetylmuramoylalanine--D-glutamate ligase n=1 Tax=Hominibacterium faecale TaxID=2839743 RepID=A0A9J6QW12_9FIRM|nr:MULTISPECIES: UDP-N-acetylmuramoyl-L-alanine--D-glutamate ligase [Eubacteriales Family XIII. Incertae Sedis]MCI7300268.1 UDP-N-acetylmuramoyl-L-alanine--D-glutamate ligase [Clostridia bacterium]MDE8734370.1 UDP-N-acetylmuramoyl-L-alanine--D-glutamate ligase [Eubacteriales bacterium DFI.9.88]MDY3010137.1 UDP-N-acetylmuramoyl-L-alanine--D-glutamate ligase [Clostridiales Family XIII bacterium]MCO7121594.1 UDP-N-acetylmuramoyl-L-alanine--D-glutamate ligase [Ihubacter massiliensis]MCU7378574.1 U
MRTNLDNIRNKNVLVIGLGRSGKAAVQAALKLGAKVYVQDSKCVEEVDPQLLAFLEGRAVTCCFGQNPEDMSIFDMLILSPGVSPELDFIREARDKGAEIIGELEIAYRIGHGNYIAITGTNGKTTTTTLVGEIFEKAKKKTYVVGNIGVAVISKALTAEENSWLVTETSSFQLETTRYFKPVVSAILNLTPDHMDRHKTMENYGNAKAKIFENQDESQHLVINYDDKACFALAEHCKAKVVPFSRMEKLDFGAFVEDGRIVIRDEDGQVHPFCRTDELIIPGSHNLENALAAAAIAYFAGIEPDVITQGLKEFQGVEHRIEYCGQVDGVRFVNDSKGTNPDASIKAVEAIDGGIVLIAGGYDKGSSYEELIKAFNGKVKHMVLLGKTAEKIKETGEKLGFTSSIIVKDMEECVKEGFRLAEPGDTVLLSPACASWDMYTSFEQRGEHFKNCVARLEK